MCLGKSHNSLRASSPVWASLARTCELGAEGSFLCSSRLRRSLARSRETRFARPNSRACSQARAIMALGLGCLWKINFFNLSPWDAVRMGWGIISVNFNFAGYLPMASQNPYPIILVTNYVLRDSSSLLGKYNFHYHKLITIYLCIYLIKPFITGSFKHFSRKSSHF